MAVFVALLKVQHIAQQGRGFDLAAVPAQILGAGDFVGLGLGFVCHGGWGNFKGKGKNCGGDSFGKGMEALGVGAAANMQVDTQIARAIFGN